MQITCKCLNVSIDTQGFNVRDINLSSLNLTATEKNDAFFKEALLLVEHGRISKVQSSIVRVRNVGLWIIHSCLNCSLNTHAIHREKGAAVVLFTKALLMDSDEILTLKNSEKFSPVFRIVIYHSGPQEASLQALTKFAVSQFPPQVQNAVSALQQQLSDIIQQETTKTEEKVRQYSEQQYAALEEFRERAHFDHRALVRLLCEDKEKLTISEVVEPLLENIETPPSTPDNHNVPTPLASSVKSVRSPASVKSIANYVSSPANALGHGDEATNFSSPSGAFKQRKIINSPVINVGGRMKLSNMTPSQLFDKSKGKKHKGSSFDTEGLFDLEGMDDNATEVMPSEEDSDTDDSGSHDEGIHIPRSRGVLNLAKSLPVNVPSYVHIEKKAIMDTDDEQLPQDPIDIAASIKALAKSVHGDANVFGDLPRPRFSTQI